MSEPDDTEKTGSEVEPKASEFGLVIYNRFPALDVVVGCHDLATSAPDY